MARWWRYALIAMVVVALLSIGVHAAVGGPGTTDSDDCARAQLSVYEDEVAAGDTVAYETLSERERTAVDRVRNRENRTGRVDAELFAELPEGVVVNGTTYRVTGYYVDCAMISGTPRWLNPLWAVFLSIYRALSDLYLPGAIAIVVILGYRWVDDWLQF